MTLAFTKDMLHENASLKKYVLGQTERSHFQKNYMQKHEDLENVDNTPLLKFVDNADDN